MSIETSRAVWQNSKARLGARLVLLALADCTNGAGTCWPSVATLCRMTLLSERAVRGAIAELMESGEVLYQRSTGPSGVNTYRIGASILVEQSLETPLNGASAPAKSAPLQSLHPCIPCTGEVQSLPQEVQSLPKPPAKFAPKPEGNRKEPEGNRKSAPVEIPLLLNTPKFQDAWEMWNNHRQQLRKPLTKTSAEQQLKKLAEMGEARAVAAIEFTVTRGWTGIFEDKDRNNATTQHHHGSQTHPVSAHNNNLNRSAVSDYRQVRKRMAVDVPNDGQGNPTGAPGANGNASGGDSLPL